MLLVIEADEELETVININFQQLQYNVHWRQRNHRRESLILVNPIK